MSEWNFHSIRELERASIRAFVEKNRGYLTGRVLDFGAGAPGTCRTPEPYRDLVSGEYLPVDAGGDRYDIAHPFDAILCTQVLQYCKEPVFVLGKFHEWLTDRGGHLVMSYPTSWDEVEGNDLWRFTRAGMVKLLTGAGFTIITHERRAEINLGGFRFPLGYGVVAKVV